MFTPSEHGELWQCPFCDPSKTVYKLTVPPAKETERLYYIKKMIREHVELHQRDLLSKMDYKDYEKVPVLLLKHRVYMLSLTLTHTHFFPHISQGPRASNELDYGLQERLQIVNYTKKIHFTNKDFYIYTLFLIRAQGYSLVIQHLAKPTLYAISMACSLHNPYGNTYLGKHSPLDQSHGNRPICS